ncbi:hypothetical protein TSOC_004577 [Tetrabaena socialis]|uniref:MYND-type domain-containing protein n=1 Tax=Tetrabaena socialis TaxID=47790 RepID=A0A2J8A8I3_9CHLO|nr:hypothetical protein TSOC_004577 [Tetrabaena socialis]|eukprot:PNH08846.1 hypothetical protein TSOC_004577 [Tetrabaena socialis]
MAGVGVLWRTSRTPSNVWRVSPGPLSETPESNPDSSCGQKLYAPLAGADLFVQYELVPHASRLLQRVVDHYAAIQASGGAESLSATTRRGLLEGDPLLQTLEFGRVLGLTLEQAAMVVGVAGFETKPYDQLPAAVRRLVWQLDALPTRVALADAVRLVANKALPAVKAAEAATAMSGAGTPQAAMQSARSSSDWPAHRTAPTAGTTAATSSSPSAHTSPYYPPSCMLLRAAAKGLALLCIGAAAVQEAGAGAAATAASQRQLLSCKVSGVLGAMCAAVLAAPMGADWPTDLATLVGAAHEDLLEAQHYLNTYLCNLALHQQSTLPALATELLAVPEVVRLRWMGLEQLAALGVEEAAGSVGPARVGWPLLNRQLLEHVNKARFGGNLSMGLVFSYIVDAAIMPVMDAWPSPDTAAPPGLTPSRQCLATLAAPIARAMCAEAEALASQLPPNADLGGLLRSLQRLSNVVHSVISGALESEKHAALPDALEAFGWVLCTAAAPWGSTSGDASPAMKVVYKMNALLLEASSLPPITLAACARRLLPTGLLRTLDFVIRQEMAGSGGVPDSFIVTACSFVLDALLVPIMRARLESCRAGAPLPLRHKAQRQAPRAGGGRGGEGGGGPLWHPQDELGLVVTLAKLVRREAAAAPALSGRQHLVNMCTWGTMLCRVTLGGTSGPTSGLVALVADLPAPPLPASGGAGVATADPRPQSPAARSAERVRAAVLETIMLCNRTLLQLLEVYCDSFTVYMGSRQFARELLGAGNGQLEHLVMVPAVLILSTIRSSAAAELLAAQPQRPLAALGRVLAGAAAAAAAARHGRAANTAVSPVWSTTPELAACVPQSIGMMAMEEQLAWKPVRAAAAAGGLGGAPLWPPRVLRLCGNPGCRNLGGGDVEADLKLQQCSGCRVLRYCCTDCQREHWRQGHKAECAAVAAGGSAGMPAVSSMPAPAVASDTAAGGSTVAGPGTGGAELVGGRWSLEELMAMRPRELKALLAARGVDCSDCVEKADLARRVLERC